MKRFIFLGIIIVAAFLRLYDLAGVPPAPSLDEVSIGYNAYSILKTGGDEYGSRLPLLLRAYDDYRPALYVYLVMPFVHLLGLSAVAVRLPSVIMSLITIWAAFGIGSIIGKKYIQFAAFPYIPAILLAVSPWHIYISRLGHEANLGLTLLTLGIYFFLDAVIAGNKYSWVPAGAALAFSIHGYQSEKIAGPLILLVAAVLFRKEILRAKYYALAAVVVGFIIAIPAVMVTFSPEGMARFSGTSAFSPDDPKVSVAVSEYVKAKEAGNRLGQILHSRYVIYAGIFMQNYVSHFSPSWLFAGGDREAHKVPGMGLLHMWEAPFLLFGLWALVTKLPRHVAAFFLVCLLAAFVPASVTTQAPHAMRAYTALPLLQIIGALGFWFAVRLLTHKEKRFFAVMLSMVIASGMTVFWKGYFHRFPREQSDSFQYAIAPAVAYAEQEQGNYARVEMANRGALNQSYMFFLFYTAFDPARYQELGGTKSGRFEASHFFDKYAFGFLPRRGEDLSEDTLYFYDIKDVPAGGRVIKRFANADGTPVIAAVRK